MGGRRYRSAGATYYVGREQESERAQVKVEQMPPQYTADPRTIVTVTIPETDFGLSETYRPPVTTPEILHEIIITSAEAAIAANVTMSHIRQRIGEARET